MEEKKVMPYGKRHQVGSYSVIKINRVLRKEDVAALRTQMGIPEEDRKKLRRAQLPYIKVSASSGIWAIEFCCNTSVYHMIDALLGEGGERNEAALAHLFNRWFMDTTVPGDSEYQEAKAEALNAFMSRIKAAEVSQEEDDATLEQLEADEKAKAVVVDMSGNVNTEGHEG